MRGLLFVKVHKSTYSREGETYGSTSQMLQCSIPFEPSTILAKPFALKCGSDGVQAAAFPPALLHDSISFHLIGYGSDALREERNHVAGLTLSREAETLVVKGIMDCPLSKVGKPRPQVYGPRPFSVQRIDSEQLILLGAQEILSARKSGKQSIEQFLRQ